MVLEPFLRDSLKQTRVAPAHRSEYVEMGPPFPSRLEGANRKNLTARAKRAMVRPSGEVTRTRPGRGWDPKVRSRINNVTGAGGVIREGAIKVPGDQVGQPLGRRCAYRWRGGSLQRDTPIRSGDMAELARLRPERSESAHTGHTLLPSNLGENGASVRQLPKGNPCPSRMGLRSAAPGSEKVRPLPPAAP